MKSYFDLIKIKCFKTSPLSKIKSNPIIFSRLFEVPPEFDKEKLLKNFLLDETKLWKMQIIQIGENLQYLGLKSLIEELNLKL